MQVVASEKKKSQQSCVREFTKQLLVPYWYHNLHTLDKPSPLAAFLTHKPFVDYGIALLCFHCLLPYPSQQTTLEATATTFVT